MKIVTFTVCLCVVVGLAFCCGWLLGPYNMKNQLDSMTEKLLYEERQNRSRFRGLLESAFQTVWLLDEQRFDDVKKLKNGELDMWIMTEYSNPSPVSFPNEKTDPEMLQFLAKLARHRQKFPVTYGDKDVTETFSNVFARALAIEGKREED